MSEQNDWTDPTGGPGTPSGRPEPPGAEGAADSSIEVYELYRVLSDPEGRRLGDTMAGTKVVEVAD